MHVNMLIKHFLYRINSCIGNGGSPGFRHPVIPPPPKKTHRVLLGSFSIQYLSDSV